ncbi:MAG: hypothetical protein AAF711_17430 [Planctomycetota bacterium]
MAIGKLGCTSGSGIETSFTIHSIYDVLDVIRQKPGIYIGSTTISNLRMFLCGFDTSMYCFDVQYEIEKPDFGTFGAFVFAHYGLKESAIGWANCILEQCNGIEEDAFCTFYEILDRFRSK